MSASLADPPARTRKKRGEGAARRGEIIEAAKRIFLAEGFRQATMRRIAAEVGVSPTALYVYFADKEAILAAIADDMFAALLTVLADAEAGADAPLDRLRAGLRAYVHFGLSRPDEYRLTFQSGSTCAKPEQADRSFEVLEMAVTALIEDGTFRRGEPHVTAEAIWCALHGLTTVLLDMGDKVTSTGDALIDAVIGMVVAGHLASDGSATGHLAAG